MVNNGALARMGAVILKGSLATALKVKAQLLVTINALKKIGSCDSASIKGILPVKKNGNRQITLVKLQKKSTGQTALNDKAFFFADVVKTEKKSRTKSKQDPNHAAKIA